MTTEDAFPSISTSSFYVAGGTLRRDAPSYVARKADTDLCEGLQKGDFCYVLDARQMGKSSLMIRTKACLEQEGVCVVVLDLTEVGQNLTLEQWYVGLLRRVGKQTDLLEPLVAFWQHHKELGPLQRWMAALRQVVLEERNSPVVLFVDEIDAVRSLPFSTDAFFAAIRACYNRRGEDPAFERLTFCLLGVAAPADLSQDVRATPFNIGRRIALSDFTDSEAEPLAQGLTDGGRNGEGLLSYILYWTGGHPYLTQRFCQVVAEDTSIQGWADIEAMCEDLFLSPTAKEVDENLTFVRDHLFKSKADSARVLKLYAQVRAGHRRVKDDPSNPLVGILRLSGIVRVVNGYLCVRNRIYHHVFDKEWLSR